MILRVRLCDCPICLRNVLKSLDFAAALCYSSHATGSLGFFFMPKNWWFSQDRQRKKYKSEVEGCARKDHIGMYGVQAA